MSNVPRGYATVLSAYIKAVNEYGAAIAEWANLSDSPSKAFRNRGVAVDAARQKAKDAYTAWQNCLRNERQGAA